MLNQAIKRFDADARQWFEQNQKDLSLDDIKILWASPHVILYKEHPDRPLTVLRDEDDLVLKVMRWCVKNCYRCSQIREGRICL